MSIDPRLVEISEYEGEGYRPLVDYGGWRVAILRYIDELAPENIKTMERHNETDEVFILLSGKCVLFVGTGTSEIGEIHAVNMLPHKLYNIKREVFHTHVLSRDAMVLIVENQDTGEANSTKLDIIEEQHDLIIGFSEKYI